MFAAQFNWKTKQSALKLGIVLAMLGWIAPDVVRACGGFFSPPQSTVYQNALRVVFGVDKATGTITEELGMRYSGSAKDFTWLMPLPSVPQVNVESDPAALDNLDGATAAQFSDPPDYCSDISTVLVPLYDGRGGGGGGPSYIEGQVGPYDYAIIQNAKPGEMLTWLHDKGYTVPQDVQPTIAAYIREGDVFLAMRLKQDAQALQNAKDSAESRIPLIQDIAPVVLTYKSNKVVLPARMGGVTQAAGPILVWIFGDSQYGPVNYAHPYLQQPVNAALSQIRAYAEVGHIGTGLQGYLTADPYDGADPPGSYDQVIKDLSDKYNGQMFVTEYAAPVTNQLGNPGGNGTIDGFLTKYHYVTRLGSVMTSAQMTLDPIFAPLPNAPDVSNIHNSPVDPLTFWGCTAASAVAPKLIAEFADSHKRFDDFQFDVGFPPGWVLSQLQVKGYDPLTITPDNLNGTPGTSYTVNVYAPRAVQTNDIVNFLAGRPAPPMMIFSGVSYPSELAWQTALYPTEMLQAQPNYQSNLNFYEGAEGMFRSILGDTRQIKTNNNGMWEESAIFPSSNIIVGAPIPDAPITGVVFALLVTPSERKAHQQLYSDLVAYANAHLYYADAHVLDTLFLVGQGYINNKNSYALPIADGWTASVDPNGDVLIRLQHTANPDLAPTMRLTSFGSRDSRFYDPPLHADDATLPDKVAALLSAYNLPAALADPITQTLVKCPVDPALTQPIPFVTDTRTGQVLFTNDYVVSIAAGSSDWPKYQPTLIGMLNDYRRSFTCRSNN